MMNTPTITRFRSRFGFDRHQVTLANWRERPFSAFAFQHVHELVPCVHLSPCEAQQLTRTASHAAHDPGEFQAHWQGSNVSQGQFLAETSSDHLLVMRDGRVLMEWSAPHYDPANPHIVFSITKSLTGLIAGRLEDEGLIDPASPVTDYLPEMAGGAYGDARLRDVLDMRVSLDFEESYLNRDGDYARYRRAMLWNPPEPGRPVEGLATLLATLKKGEAAHGGPFAYQSPNSDLLALLVERVSGRRWHELLQEHFRGPMRIFDPAFLTVDGFGAPRGAGGYACTSRELAAFGQLLLDDGMAGGARLVSRRWLEDMRENGDRHAWDQGDFRDFLPGGSYRSQWYRLSGEWPAILAVGIHGQFLFADPLSRTVIVKFGSQAEPQSDALDAANIAFLKGLTLLP